MTRMPSGAAELVAATADGAEALVDCCPTQPILAVGRRQVGLVGARHTDAPRATGRRVPSTCRHSSRHQRAAAAGGVSSRGPSRTAVRPARSLVLIVLAVVIVAVTGALGSHSWTPSSPPATSEPSAGSVPTSPATTDRRTGEGRRRPPPAAGRDGARDGALGEADGVVPDGVTVFDDVPAVTNLDPALLAALRQAAADAADDGIEFSVNSGWRSRAYQDQLLREAVTEYGSDAEAARWVATADTSPHVSGDAVDIGPTAATAWLSQHGAEFGLCRIYGNEPWHYELRPDAVDDGCPPVYADPTHDPRMQR
jgi:D-alanyl-D-alanine carboxypeptidase